MLTVVVLVIVAAACPLVAVLVIVMLVTEAGYDVGACWAFITAPPTALTARETEVVSDRTGVKPLGVGMVVVPDVTVSVT